jgi:hypothetical protein
MVDGETGLVFRAGSTDALAAAITYMVSDPQRITSMGCNARRFTLDKAPDSNETYSTILQLDPRRDAPVEGSAFTCGVV